LTPIVVFTASKSSFFKAVNYYDPLSHIAITITLWALGLRQKEVVGEATAEADLI